MPICETYTIITQRTSTHINLFSLMNQGAINGLDLDRLGSHPLVLLQSKLPGSNVSNDIRYFLYIHRIALSLYAFSGDLQMGRYSRRL
jgi:hypothetical protein